MIDNDRVKPLIQDILPVKIYCESLEDSDPENYNQLQTSFSEILQTIDLDTIGKPDDWPENVAVSFRNKKPNKLFDGRGEIEYIITQKCKDYLAYGYDIHAKIKLADSWVNRFDKTQYQFTHNHLANPDDASFVSGTYYYDSSGHDGNIIFANKVQNGLTISGQALQPKTGMLCMFPAWLDHCVEANRTDKRRISFAFNFIKDDIYGY